MHSYLPQDWSRVLLSREELPDRTHWTALFADIIRLYPMTKKTDHRTRPRRGAEELSSGLNQIYDVLIGVLESYGSNVIGFARNAITCWFEKRLWGTVVNGLLSAVNALSIRHVQEIVTCNSSTLLDLTIGDKGSYIPFTRLLYLDRLLKYS